MELKSVCVCMCVYVLPALCRDYVKKIAVYKDKLAVQLPSKIVIYELANSGACTHTHTHTQTH